jgi:DNA primase
MLLETYTKTHLRSILHALNVEIVSDTSTDFLCLCPFHNNRSTPSFAISHNKGLYVCYNPSCNAAGTILDLVKSLSQRNDFEALRFIGTMKKESEVGFDDELANLLEEKPDFVEFSKNTLDKLSEDRWNSVEACNYFLSRGINHESMDYFDLGYSEKQRMVTVPVHSPDGIPVGIVGRSIEGKSFKNSSNLPRNKTMFNLHRAKRAGGTIIVTESSFDAIRVHQAGFPGAVATLGGSLSEDNLENLNKYSSKIIIMTDADEAGRKLGKLIANKLKMKDILWASYQYGMIYPHNAKDVGDLTDEEIQQCIKNAVPHFEYINW